jgi:glutathione S-transferase
VERFSGAALLPSDIKERARMRQIMRVMDNHGYRDFVWGIYVEETERNRAGGLEQHELDRAATCLRVLDNLSGPGFLAAPHLTLADLWVLPMLAYLSSAPTGVTLLQDVPKLSAWLNRMQDRPSVQATRFHAERAVG